ncbi:MULTISPECIES: hypothetical protein [Streptomyces]|uniref:Uncharacterized protein n=1 Tax=Streptomyces lateritius TaxID=67313 RepID=A0ABW6Y9D9_9ACTN|nr:MULTISPECIES: hypothetical protein [Streptomyces]QGZ48177.1 hypothetical protein GPZ77_07065 [Streptomyces sp. QHH-9511]GGT75765.1 hypothetical protein GCM10010272_18830 [Streptomyces lateritius]
MTALAVRPLLSTAVATLALGAVAMAGAPAAVAAPGDNGDVKVHHAGRPDEPPRTPETDQRNEPKVCTFYFAALNFDGLQALNWEISPQPPKGGVIKSGSITVDAEGNGFTPDLELPDGMYKVEWTWAGQMGAKKSKVFRVDCDDFTNPPPNGNGKPPHHKPPHGPVGAGGGGSAELASDDSSAFGVGTAIAAGVAGTAGLILIRRSRRRTDGAA